MDSGYGALLNTSYSSDKKSLPQYTSTPLLKVNYPTWCLQFYAQKPYFDAFLLSGKIRSDRTTFHLICINYRMGQAKC